MKSWAKPLILWFFLGEQYFVIEAVYRQFWKGGEQAHLAMLAVGGTACVLVGAINQKPRFYRMPMLAQAVIGALLVLVVELAAGLILNVWLGLEIWDYSHLPFNLWGQVCPQFAATWLFFMPICICMEDFLWLSLECNGNDYRLGDASWTLITNNDCLRAPGK